MAIRRPQPRFSGEAGRLLKLLSKLALDESPAQHGSNVGAGNVSLTDWEADELARLLDLLNRDDDFLSAAQFVEAVCSGALGTDQISRHIFERERQLRGRSGTAGWIQWYEFRRRFFHDSGEAIGDNRSTISSTQPMLFDHFVRMERQLLYHLSVDRRLVDLALAELSAQRQAIEQLRTGQLTLASGFVVNAMQNFERSLSASVPMRPERIAGAVSLVADLGVLFTTRDWGVAGTMSAIGGASVMAMMP